jgi:hypothetical protein
MKRFLTQPATVLTLALAALVANPGLARDPGVPENEGDELARRIDDASVKVRADRPWSATGRSGLGEPISCASYRPSCNQSAWSFSFTPFLWAPAQHGHVTVKGRTFTVDTSIVESLEGVFENFEFAAMSRFEAHRGKWSTLVDAIFLRLGNDVGFDVAGVPVSAEWDLTQLTLQPMLGYQVACLPLGCGDACFKPHATVDALAGIRVYHMEVDLDLDPGPEFSGSQTWVDPVAGVRMLFHVTPRLTFNLSADVGGFGIGSDVSWRLIGGADYKINRCVSISAGWAILDVDYESGDFAYDVTQSGPYLGATFRF